MDSSSPADAPVDPAIAMDPVHLHALAQSMWWVSEGDRIATDPARRDLMWREESEPWLVSARELVRHLHHNGLTIRPRA